VTAISWIPNVHLPQVPLRKRTETLEDFNKIPAHVFPASSGRAPRTVSW
jgi:diaminopimelate decarboxylase